MLSEQKIESKLREIADKILSRLSEDLAAAAHFSTFKKGAHSFLSLDFALKLDSSDYPRVLSIIRDFNGDFGNRKEEGKDVGFFFVPEPKPETDLSLPVLAKTGNATSSTVPNLTAKSDVTPKTASTPAEEKKDPQPQKPPELPKQPSPMTQFKNNYCSVCEDLGDKCNSTTFSGREYRKHCLETLTLQALQSINLGGLTQFCYQISENIKNLKLSLPPSPAVPKQETPLPKSEPVQRNTRPVEGHKEDGIVWINDFNAKGEPIEKALEKDNEQSAHFAELLNQIDDEVRAGKKGLKINGKWYWLYQNGTTIGRKPAQEWPQRRR